MASTLHDVLHQKLCKFADFIDTLKARSDNVHQVDFMIFMARNMSVTMICDFLRHNFENKDEEAVYERFATQFQMHDLTGDEKQRFLKYVRLFQYLCQQVASSEHTENTDQQPAATCTST